MIYQAENVEKIEKFSVRFYTVLADLKDEGNSIPTLPNVQHLHRRIMLDIVSFDAENPLEGWVQYSFDRIENLKNFIQYFRAYCKHRRMFVAKLEILHPSEIFKHELIEWEMNAKGNELIYQESEHPVLHFKNDALVEASD